MASLIDPNIPITGNPTTLSVRQNFATAKAEIEALQLGVGGGPYLLLTGGALTGQLMVNPTIVIGNPVTSPPATSLVINKTASTPQAATVVPNLWLAADSGAALMLLDVYGTSGNNITARRSRGTAAAPTSVQSLDTLFVINGQGRGATTYSGNQGQILLQAAEAWSDTAQGTQLSFSTTPIGTTAQAQRVYINRGVVIGNPAPDPGQGGLVLNANAAATFPPISNFCGVRAIGGDGQFTTVSSTAFGAAPTFGLHHTGGTAAAPVTPPLGQFIGAWQSYSWNGSAYAIATSLSTLTAEAWSATSNGSLLVFSTVANGTTGAAERVRIDHNGNVGIGTAAPGARLEVAATARITNAIAPVGGAGLELSYTGGFGYVQAYDRAAAAYRSLTLQGDVVAINPNSGGNVGIGTTTPGHKLEVNSDIFAIAPSGGQGSVGCFDRTAGNFGAYMFSAPGYTGIATVNNTGAFQAIGLAITGVGGNVGIGTTAPTEKLTVVGGIKVKNGVMATNEANAGGIDSATGLTRIFSWGPDNTTMGAFQFLQQSANGSAGNTSLFITTTGSVGVGTTAPGNQFEVGSGAAASRITAAVNGGGSGTSAGGMFLLRNGGSSIAAFGNASAIAGSAYDATPMIWATGNFTMAPVGNLALTPGGNVGIGTTAPAASSKLHVLGGGIGEMRVEGTSFAKLMYNINSNATDKKKWQVYGNTTAFLIEALNDTETTSIPAIICQRGAGNTISSVDFPTGTTRNVSGAWVTISDASVKESVQPYTRGLDAIVALNPVAFSYVAGTPFAEGDKPSRRLFGLIADEVKPHVPEIVGTTTATIGKKEGVTLSTLEPGNLIYALINAVKELNAKVDALTPPPARRKAA